MWQARGVIRQILLIYLTTTGIFLAIFFTFWYDKLTRDLLASHAAPLKDMHRTIVLSVLNSKLVPLEQSCQSIANVSQFKFAILDDKRVFCSDLSISEKNLQSIDFKHRPRMIYESKVLFSAPMSFSNFFLQNDNNMQESSAQSTLRTIIEGADLSKELLQIKLLVLFVALLSFGALGVIAYFLVKTSLRPLELKIQTLNSFIKDFTHEINTPLSVILLSIEQIQKQKSHIDENKLKRMKIAAKTLSQVYSDLIFYTFPQKVDSTEEQISLEALILERLSYFSPFFEQKNIRVSYELDAASTIFASKAKIQKVLDNLISNAIKYNKKGGDIDIELGERYFSIFDSGPGIKKEDLKHIFDRYARFNQDQGGFGIGLSIVQTICKEYKIKISCNSELGVGTAFTLEW